MNPSSSASSANLSRSSNSQIISTQNDAPRRKRKRTSAVYESPRIMSCVEARQTRKRLLNQHRLAKRGQTQNSTTPLQYGCLSEEYIEALKVSYPNRSYCGTPDYECQYCHAVFWYRERVRSSQRDASLIYNNCCKGGKIKIPPYRPRPEPLASLTKFDGDSASKKFLRNIRQYNCLFAFTSMGANIDNSVNDGRGPPLFKICGQVHHRIGSLLPPDGSPPKFIQLYIYDTANEVQNRLKCLNENNQPVDNLDQEIVQNLIKMLDDHNPFAKKFRMARDRLPDHESEEFTIRIIGAKEGDPVQYSLPTTDELAMLIVGDFSLDTFKRDIIIETQSKELKRISALHPAFMALQYPLLFPFGERGFQVGVLYNGVNPANKNTRKHMTMQEFYCYQFHYRKNQPNPYLCYGLLSSQAKVDARACVDENRLNYIIQNQKKLRIESIQGISDAVSRGCISGDQMGQAIVLPASHTGGRRYMIQNYHDSIAICRVYGPPDFFVTFTCNSNWPEILESFYELGQKPPDRSDVIVRVYHMKLEEILSDIRSGTIFGPCNAVCRNH